MKADNRISIFKNNNKYNQDEFLRKLHEHIDNLFIDKNLDDITSSIAFAKGIDSFKSFNKNANHDNSLKENNYNDWSTESHGKQVMFSDKTDQIISNSLEDTINLYKSIGDRNADILFHWIYNIYNEIFLPSIDPIYKEDLTLTKTKLGIYDVLIDDLADNAKLRNGKLLEECMAIPWNNTSNNDQYVSVCRKIWADCINQIKKYPRYNEFKDIFYFDLHQFMNCNRYSYLVNTKSISNFTEDKTNLQHGVMVLTHCNLDLMCSPDFNYNELEKLRPILYWVQDFIHIGNMINTYPREIEELDLSSPIISLAIRKGLIQQDTLKDDPEYAFESIKPLIPIFEKRMKDDLSNVNKYIKEIDTINLDIFYKKLKNVGNEFVSRKPYWKQVSLMNNYKDPGRLF
jgi:hypothetical protein